MTSAIHYLPTPAELEIRCETIRLGWTDEERAKRQVKRHRGVPWRVPVIPVRQFVEPGVEAELLMESSGANVLGRAGADRGLRARAGRLPGKPLRGRTGKVS